MSNLFEEYKGGSTPAYNYILKSNELFVKYKLPDNNKILVIARSMIALNNIIKKYGLSDKRFDPLIKKLVFLERLPIKNSIGAKILEVDFDSDDIEKGRFSDLASVFDGLKGGDSKEGKNNDYLKPLLVLGGAASQISEKLASIENKMHGIEGGRKKEGFGYFLTSLILVGLIVFTVLFYEKFLLIANGREYILQTGLGFLLIVFMANIIFSMRRKAK